MLINRLGLLEHEFLRPVGINPSRHPRLIAGDDGPSISGSPPREKVLDEGIYASVLQHQILECIAYVTCSSIVSIPCCGEGKDSAGHRIQTALVECVVRAVSKTIRTRNLREPGENAELLHPWQENRVW